MRCSSEDRVSLWPHTHTHTHTQDGDWHCRPPTLADWLAGPAATHSTPLSSSSSRRRRRPINQFRGLPYASLSARRETGEAVGRPPARPSPSLSPRTRPAASPSPPLSSSDSATINIWCSGRQTDSSRLLQAAGRPAAVWSSVNMVLGSWAGWRGNQYPQGCLIALQPSTQR